MATLGLLLSFQQQQQPSTGVFIFELILAIIGFAAEWKIFTKAGQPGWACIIPIYNLVVFFRIIYGNGLKWLLMLVPLLNIAVGIMMYVRLGQRFGKSTGFIIGLIFLSPIFMCILAFDDSYYQGPDTQSFI